jgi:hypothetical protein
MSAMSWAILWVVIIVGSVLLWFVLIRRTVLKAKNLQSEISRLFDAFSSMKAARQTRLHSPHQAPNKKGH